MACQCISLDCLYRTFSFDKKVAESETACNCRSDKGLVDEDDKVEECISLDASLRRSTASAWAVNASALSLDKENGSIESSCCHMYRAAGFEEEEVEECMSPEASRRITTAASSVAQQVSNAVSAAVQAISPGWCLSVAMRFATRWRNSLLAPCSAAVQAISPGTTIISVHEDGFDCQESI